MLEDLRKVVDEIIVYIV